MEIDIRNRIENLLKWLVPFFLLHLFAGTSVHWLFNQFGSDLFGTNGQKIDALQFLTNSLNAVGLSYKAVVSVWLYFQAKELKFNRFLWPFLGLMEPFAAIGVFVLVILYENCCKEIKPKKHMG